MTVQELLVILSLFPLGLCVGLWISTRFNQGYGWKEGFHASFRGSSSMMRSVIVPTLGAVALLGCAHAAFGEYHFPRLSDDVNKELEEILGEPIAFVAVTGRDTGRQVSAFPRDVEVKNIPVDDNGAFAEPIETSAITNLSSVSWARIGTSTCIVEKHSNGEVVEICW